MTEEEARREEEEESYFAGLDEEAGEEADDYEDGDGWVVPAAPAAVPLPGRVYDKKEYKRVTSRAYDTVVRALLAQGLHADGEIREKARIAYKKAGEKYTQGEDVD